MIAHCSVLLTVFLLACVSVARAAQQEKDSLVPVKKFEVNAMANQFSATLEMDKTSYQSADKILMTFRLTNEQPEDTYVLKWHTALEGFRNKFLTVTVNGKELLYRGIMAKRGNPSADSYVLISAGQTVDATLDLREAYRFEESGTCKVVMGPRLMDVIPKKAGTAFVPHTLDQLSGASMTVEPVQFKVSA